MSEVNDTELTRHQKLLLSQLSGLHQEQARADFEAANERRASFEETRSSPERREIYDRVPRGTASAADLLVYMFDELREANLVLPPTCDAEGRPQDGAHASTCIMRATSALIAMKRLLAGGPQ